MAPRWPLAQVSASEQARDPRSGSAL